MSFPSAQVRIQAGDTAEDALLYAMEHDTADGYNAIMAVAQAAKESVDDPVAFVRQRVSEEYAESVLRSEKVGEKGVKVDFDPLSKLGMQVARLMGTDVARPLVEKRAGMSLGFANCCGTAASEIASDVAFTAGQQVKWQLSLDC